jgi:5-methylcytosine-specific restriction endonuclease McrA
MSLVWVQCDEFTGWATRIFKNQKAALSNVENFVQQMDRALAVSQIRRQIFQRQEGVCINCPEMITWNSMHMHEKISRGDGGDISLENSEGLCAACHILGPRSIHGKERSPQFTKRTTEEWEPRTR